MVLVVLFSRLFLPVLSDEEIVNGAVNQPDGRASTPPSSKKRASNPWLEKGEPTAQGKCASSILAEGGWGAWLSVFAALAALSSTLRLWGIAKGVLQALP